MQWKLSTMVSADGYVRIPLAGLSAIRMHHVSSAIDLSIALPDDVSDPNAITGFTEWAGEWDGEQISIGWDWAVLDGRLTLLGAAEIRTNILVLEPNGGETRAASIAALASWIEQLPWRTTAIPELLQDSDEGSS